jgi:hypothetical protein
MKNIIENSEDQFANGQFSRDLRVNSDAPEPKTQIDAVNVIEQCPYVAREEFFRSRKPGRDWQRRRSQLLPEQIDADERLPGYLREPHLPRLESRRARNFANSLGIADQSESLLPACTLFCCTGVTLNTGGNYEGH